MDLFPRMHLSKLSATFSAACLFLVPTLSHAASISVSGQLTVSANYGSEFVTGDTFNFSFTLDDTTTDSRFETFAGQFSPGVSGFSLVKGSGAGTWNPSTGVFAAVNNFATNANGESVTLQVGGSGFPQIGGSNFLDVGLTFAWTSSVRDFVDTGSGQTFAEQVGTSGLDFSTANSYFYAELRNASFAGPQMTMSVTGAPTAVPEPTSYAAGPLALLCAILYRRRRR